VTFAPTASGAPNGTLTVSSDAIGSPARIALAVVDFSIAAAAGGTTAQTVTAGQNAVYKLVLSSAGFTGQVAFSCSGAPPGATCAVNPSAVSLSGALTAPFTVTVTTAARSSAQLALPAGSSPGMWWSFSIAPALFGLIWLPGSRVRSRNVYRCLGVLALAVTLVAVMLFATGCGGGGSNATPVSTITGTPAGTSTIVVTAASGAVTHSQNLTLTVN
jgi:hypothetical protein